MFTFLGCFRGSRRAVGGGGLGAGTGGQRWQVDVSATEIDTIIKWPFLTNGK